MELAMDGWRQRSPSCSRNAADRQPRSLSADAADADQCLPEARSRSGSIREKYELDLANDILRGGQELSDDQLEPQLCMLLCVSSSTARKIMKGRPRAHIPRRASDLASGGTSKKSGFQTKHVPNLTSNEDLPDFGDAMPCPFLEPELILPGVAEVVHLKSAPAPSQSYSKHGGDDSASLECAPSASASSPNQDASPSSVPAPAPAISVSAGNSATLTLLELLKLPYSDHKIDILANACNMFSQCPTLGSVSQLFTNEDLDNSELMLIFQTVLCILYSTVSV